MALFAILTGSLLAVATASESLFARNNPPQPPCVYPYTSFVYSGCYADAVANRALPFQAELEFNNATVEQCTAYCKGNNYRYAGLEYHGQCFCGTSVSAPKASEKECNFPCNGDSTQACGGEDRLSVYQDPTFLDADDIAISNDYLSLGCYTEGDSGRSLDYSQWDYLNISAMTTEMCLTACGANGFPFAGTEFGRECYCGVVLGNGTVSTDPTQCSSPCLGNGTQLCGGVDRLSLYVAKNLESTEPCGPPVISPSSSSVSSATSTLYSCSSFPSSTPTSFSSDSSLTLTPPSSSEPSSLSTASISTSSKIYSTSASFHTTSSVCLGYHCPKTTSKKLSSSSAEKSTSTPCKTTTTFPSSRTSIPKPKTTSTSAYKSSSSSIKNSSTLRTTTSCATTAKTTAKSTAKSTSTKKHDW